MDIGNDSGLAGDEMIVVGVVYYNLKTGAQVEAIKQSPKDEYWIVKRLKDHKMMLLPAWVLEKEPEAYGEEAQMLAKKKSRKRREEGRERKLEELFET